MIIIMGKTSSGKDTIVNKLVSDYGFKKLITYTTRSIRPNEKQDITYHFISDEEFKNKIENNFFAEWKSYNTEFGQWYYGTSLDNLENADNKTIVILTPDGLRDIKNKLSFKPKVIYIYANNTTIKERLSKRGDNKEEAQRRLEYDNEDFKGIENETDQIFCNNKDTDIDEVVQKIIQWLGE